VDNPTPVLDLEQLREVTLDDAELMREILTTLLDDTALQMDALTSAIGERDPERCKRLAHYCKGACANVGANAAAEVLIRMEQHAAAREFEKCSASLAALGAEMDRLRIEAGALQ
jgi:HPt (histidine-containing phosphotransfer) domain-containing protein